VRASKAIRFQIHAKRRMAQRGVSEEQVRRVIRDPDQIRPAKRNYAIRLEKKLSKRKRLCVIADDQGRNTTWVISAFWM